MIYTILITFLFFQSIKILFVELFFAAKLRNYQNRNQRECVFLNLFVYNAEETTCQKALET